MAKMVCEHVESFGIRRLGAVWAALKGGLLGALIVVAFAHGAWAADGTIDWTKALTPDGLTPENPADWTKSENWVDGIVPSGDTSVAFLAPKAQTTSLAGTTYFIKVPEGGVSLGGYSSRRGVDLRIIGGPVTASGTSLGAGASYSQPIMRDETAGATYCNVYWYTELYFGSNMFVNRNNFCAPIHFADGLSSVTMNISDNYRHLGNWYATSDDTEMKDEFFAGTYNMGSGYLSLYGRAGASEQVGTWKTIENSPYLRRVGDFHALAPGCHVSGTGIPEGAYLKRVFAKDLIEISAPATATSGEEGVAVTFAAYTPTTTAHIDCFQLQGNGEARFGLVKTRAEDTMRVYVNKIYGRESQNYVIDTELVERFLLSGKAQRFPGTLIFKDATGHNKRPLQLGLSDLEFWPNGNSITGNVPRVRITGDSRITVSNGWVTAINSLEELSGKLIKAGAGEIYLNMQKLTTDNLAALNAIVCEEGLVSFSTTSLTSEDKEPSLASLTLNAGAGFRLLAGSRLEIAQITVAEKSKIIVEKGAFLLLPAGTNLEGITIEGAGDVAFDHRANERADTGMDAYLKSAQYDPGVKGTPAFWVTAQSLVDETSAGVVETENGTNFITRLNDWRGAQNGGPHFATNLVLRPYLTTNITGFTSIQMTGDTNGGKAENCSALIWDEPISTIRTVFAVLDVTDGYGSILGATRRLTDACYVRGSRSIDSWLIYRYGSDGACGSTNVASSDALCFVNGQETVTLKRINGIVQKGVAVIEIGALGDTSADAFGIINAQNNFKNRYDLCGGEKILEYIIYTNDLTAVERHNTHHYLLNKYNITNCWAAGATDKRYRIDAITSNAVPGHAQAVDVSAGNEITVVSISNATDVVKTGSGSLYVLDCVNGDGSITVRGGTLALNTEDPLKLTLPEGAYLHLDADADSTLTTQEDAQGITRVTEWRDPTSGKKATLVSPNSTNKPSVLVKGLNNRNVLDFGPALANIGNFKSTTSPSFSITPVRDLRTVFTVLGTAGGGGTILGGTAGRNDNLAARIRDSSYLGLWRDVQGSPTDYTMALIGGSNRGQVGSYITELKDMSMTEVCRNGEVVDQSKVGFTGGYDLISIRSPNALMEANLINGIHYGNQVGGQQIAELLYYQRVLRWEEFNETQSYFMKKWYNRETPMYRSAEVAAVNVEAGATLEVLGSGDLKTASLGGSGIVKGNITLNAGVQIVAHVSALGLIEEPLTIQGTLVIPETGNVLLADNAEGLLPGTYPILSATSLSGAITGLTVSPKCHHQHYSLYVDGNTLYLRMTPPGTSIFIR